MKERSSVYAKILFLILSINLFLCFDIVECTEKLLTFVNLSLEEKNKIPILNPMCNSDYKYHNGVAFGKLSETEQKEEYIANFVQYIEENEGGAVFLEIIFTMNKSWENTDLFKKLKSTDEAIIFEHLEEFLCNHKEALKKICSSEGICSSDVLQEIRDKDAELRKQDANVINRHSNKNLTVKPYYVIISKKKLQKLVNIIEKGIIEFWNKYEYIAYSFKLLYPHLCLILNLDLEFENVFNLVDYPSLQYSNLIIL